MSQHSEERVPEELASSSSKAQVLAFERPQSELQKAVQQRAQETIDRERARAAQQRPAVWRRALVLALAAIPVIITFGAAIGFVGALRQFNTAVMNSGPPSGGQQASPLATNEASASSPAASSEPGVVLLQPYSISPPPQQEAGKPPVTSEAP